MSVLIEHAAWAGLAGALGLAALTAGWIARRAGGAGAARRSWRWVSAGVFLPLMSAVCLALAMAGVSLVLTDSADVLVLLDFSASGRGSPWHDPAWVRMLAEKRLGPDRTLTIVGAGADDAQGPRILLESVKPKQVSQWPMAWPEEIVSSLEANSAGLARTDIAAALNWRAPAESQGSGNRRAARWVITDGLFAEPAGGGRAGSGPLAWTIIPPAKADVAVSDLVVRTAGSGAGGTIPVEILAQIRAVARGGGVALRATVEVARDGKVMASEPVEFHLSAEGTDGRDMADRARWISVRDMLDADAANVPHRYEVRLKAAAGAALDRWPEDDAGSIVWAAPEKLRVLVVGDALPRLAGPDLVMQRVDADRFTGDVRELSAAGWQAIVLNDLSAETIVTPGPAALSAAAAQGVDQFVRDLGGGLLILTNGHAFGPGRYGEGGAVGQTLEELSPVWSHPHQGESLHVIFVVDAGASMNEPVTSGTGEIHERKFRLLSAGITRAAELLSGDDRITLIAFNNEARTLLSGPVRDARGELARVLAAVQPAGPTVPDTALEPLAAALRGTTNAGPAGRPLVILVTDGEIPAMDWPQWKALLAPGAGKGGPVNLCLVAPAPARTGPAAPLEALAGAVPGTRWFKTQDASTWAALLHGAIAEQVRGGVGALPLDWQYQPTAGDGIRGRAGSWTRIWAKPESTLLVEGRASGETNAVRLPLAALAQRGLGETAAVAISDQTSAVESEEYVNMRNDILQRIAAGPGDRRFHVTTRREEGGGWLVNVEGIEPATGQAGSNGQFINSEHLVLRRLSAEGSGPREITLTQTAPGYYVTHLDVAGPLSAVIVRKLPAGSVQGEALVSRVQTAHVQNSEWPAIVGTPMIPKKGIILPAAGDDASVWNPEVDHTISLANGFWVVAILAALAALYLRRG